jgi:hypothetical protein
MWVLVGCGTFILAGVVVVILLGYFVWNKAKEAGLDPELMKNHPAQAVGKMVVAMNPDVELVSADDVKGTITVRDKKTGKVVTVNLEQARNGNIKFKAQDNGEEVSIEAKGDANKGTVEVKSPTGSATFSAGTSAELPDWLPAYPGGTTEGNFSARAKDGMGGSFGFTTTDSVQTVMSFYEDHLRQAGFKVTTMPVQQDGQVISGTVSAEDADKKRTAFVSVTANEGKSQVGVVFKSS